jgi:hypothetical protein
MSWKRVGRIIEGQNNFSCSGGLNYSVLIILFNFLLFTTTATAHHIRGIPHYSYQENYPQAPAFEEFRESGSWELQFTYWQIPSQPALDLALYVKRLDTEKPYTGAVTLQVFKQGEDESTDLNHPVNAYANPRNIYKVGWVYEEAGVYIVKVDMGEGAEKISERFTIQVGTVAPNYWFLGGAAFVVVGLMAAVAIIKKRSENQSGCASEIITE